MNNFRRNGLAVIKATCFLAVVLPLVAISPAKAQSCVLDGSGNSTTGLTVANLKQAGFTCTVGDKIYSNFGSFTGFADTNVVQISQSSAPNFLNHTFRVNSAGAPWGVGTYGFNYTVSVTGSSNTFLGYSASSTSSIFDPVPPAGTFVVDGLAPSSPAAAIAPSIGGGGVATYNASNITSDTFSLTLNVTAGLVETVSSTVAQQVPVPGPLPILGAGAAFAFSRRLRKRIKQFS